MALIAQRTVDAVRSADLITYAQATNPGAQVKRTGHAGQMCCPFHDDSKPSMTFKKDTDGVWRYKCWVCDIGGDIVDWYRHAENSTFAEAVEALAEHFNIPIEKTGAPDNRRTKGPDRKKLMREAMRTAQEYCQAQLTQETPGAHYLATRGISLDIAEEYGIGYMPPTPDGLWQHLRTAGHSLETCEAAGLIRIHNGRTYDYVSNRLTFAIRSTSGHTIAFGARKLSEDDPLPGKYVNTKKTDLYDKSSVLYLLDRAGRHVRTTKKIVVCEGYFDAIALHIAGIENAVAPCGTALTAEHARLTHHNYGATTAILAFDGDTAGRKAALGSLATLSNNGYITIRAVELPTGEDPADIWQNQGPDALKKLVTNNGDLPQVLIKKIVETISWNPSPSAKVQAAHDCIPILDALATWPTMQSYYRSEVIRQTGISPTELPDSNKKQTTPGTPGDNTPPPASTWRTQAEKALLHCITQSREAWEAYADALAAIAKNPKAAELATHLAGIKDMPTSAAPEQWATHVAENTPEGLQPSLAHINNLPNIDPRTDADQIMTSILDDEPKPEQNIYQMFN